MEAQHQHRSRIQHQQKNKPEETKKNQNKTLFAFYQNDTLDIKKEMNKIKISVSLPRKQDSFRTPLYRYRYFQREWRKIFVKKNDTFVSAPCASSPDVSDTPFTCR